MSKHLMPIRSLRLPSLAGVALLALAIAGAAGASQPRWTDSPTIMIQGNQVVAGNGGWLTESGDVTKYVFRFSRDGMTLRGPDSVPMTTPPDVIPANTYPDVPDANYYTLQPADAGRQICVEVWGGTHSIHHYSNGDLAYDVWEWGHVNVNGEPARRCTIAPGTPGGGTPTPPSGPPTPALPAVIPPTVTSAPSITGTAMVEENLTASNGLWSGTAPMTVLVRWERCDAQGENCSDAGVAGDVYTLIGFDIGKTLRAVVTMSNAAGTQTARSQPTAVVTELLPTEARPWIPATKVLAPHHLVIDGVSFAPKRLTKRARVTATVRVSDDRGFRIEGARVSAVVLPASSLIPTGEVTTDQDGLAKLTFLPGPKLNLRKPGSITLVVAARRPDDRLVSPRTARVRAKLTIGPAKLRSKR
jgi:hypothetical protein